MNETIVMATQKVPKYQLTVVKKSHFVKVTEHTRYCTQGIGGSLLIHPLPATSTLPLHSPICLSQEPSVSSLDAEEF